MFGKDTAASRLRLEPGLTLEGSSASELGFWLGTAEGAGTAGVVDGPVEAGATAAPAADAFALGAEGRVHTLEAVGGAGGARGIEVDGSCIG